MIELLFFLCLALPVAWLVSEAQSRRWISVVLGIAAISLAGVVAYSWAQFWTKFERNVYFGNSNKKLLSALSKEFVGPRADYIRKELSRIAMRSHENYEDYPRYSEEVDQLVSLLTKMDSKHANSSSESTSTIYAADGQVTVQGKYHSAGKFGPYIKFGDTAVYLVAEGSSSWPDFERQQVEVSGLLRLAPALISEQDSVAGVPARLLLTTSPESIVVIEDE